MDQAIARPHVFVLVMNDAVLGVFQSRDVAQQEAEKLMQAYRGSWQPIFDGRWATDDERTWVGIDRHVLHG